MFDPIDEKAMAQLRKLYPDLSDEQLREAELVLTQYLELAWEIYEESVLSKRPDQERAVTDFKAVSEKSANGTVF